MAAYGIILLRREERRQRMSKVTILLETTTRDELKAVGRKGQTYDQLILEMIHEYHQLKQKEKVGLVCLQ